MPNYKDIAYWIVLLFIIALGIYVIVYIKTESFQCMNNPYTYSIKLLEKANNATVNCMCTVLKDNPTSVILTRDGFKTLPLQG